MAKVLSRALSSSAAASAAAGVDALTTITFRLPVLFGEPIGAALEWHRAWTEKVAATVTGTMQASFELQRLGIRIATGSASIHHLPHDLLKVAEVATDPGYRSVAANARRLRKVRGKSSRN